MELQKPQLFGDLKTSTAKGKTSKRGWTHWTPVLRSKVRKRGCSNSKRSSCGWPWLACGDGLHPCSILQAVAPVSILLKKNAPTFNMKKKSHPGCFMLRTVSSNHINSVVPNIWFPGVLHSFSWIPTKPAIAVLPTLRAS